jgi:hypothetical protein
VDVSYEELRASASPQQRIELWNRATYASRAAIMRTHVQRWLEANRESLTAEQIAFMEENIAMVAPDWYEPANLDRSRERMESMLERGYRLFSREQLAMALMPNAPRA